MNSVLRTRQYIIVFSDIQRSAGFPPPLANHQSKLRTPFLGYIVRYIYHYLSFLYIFTPLSSRPVVQIASNARYYTSLLHTHTLLSDSPPHRRSILHFPFHLLLCAEQRESRISLHVLPLPLKLLLDVRPEASAQLPHSRLRTHLHSSGLPPRSPCFPPHSCGLYASFSSSVVRNLLSPFAHRLGKYPP